MKVFGGVWKFSEVFEVVGCFWKSLCFFGSFWRFSEVLGGCCRFWEVVVGVFEVFGCFLEIFGGCLFCFGCCWRFLEMFRGV